MTLRYWIPKHNNNNNNNKSIREITHSGLIGFKDVTSGYRAEQRVSYEKERIDLKIESVTQVRIWDF